MTRLAVAVTDIAETPLVSSRSVVRSERRRKRPVEDKSGFHSVSGGGFFVV